MLPTHHSTAIPELQEITNSNTVIMIETTVELNRLAE